MKYFELKPSSALANYVKCFWFLEKDFSTSISPVETILPDGCVDFIFQSGESVLQHLIAGQTVRQPSAFVIGPQKAPLLLTAVGKTRTLGVRFYAYGAYPFLRSSLKEFTNRTVDMKSLYGNLASELVEQANSLPPLAAFRGLESFLISRLSVNHIDDKHIRGAIRFLFQQKGAVDIAGLAGYVNLSTRTLERKFEEVVGYSPKAFARVARFDHIKDEMMFNPALSLTDLAYRYGYFDQAHFIQDFKQFAGKTPSMFVESVIDREIAFYK